MRFCSTTSLPPETRLSLHRHSSAADIARVAAYLPTQRPGGLGTLLLYKALLGPIIWARDALLYAAMVASKCVWGYCVCVRGDDVGLACAPPPPPPELPPTTKQNHS